MSRSARDLPRREVDGVVELDVPLGEITYGIRITSARGMNYEVVGYRATIVGGRLHPTIVHAEAAAIQAIERLPSPRQVDRRVQ